MKVCSLRQSRKFEQLQYLQTLLTEDPTPAAKSLQDSMRDFVAQSGGRTDLAKAVQEAYQSVGLLRRMCIENDAR